MAVTLSCRITIDTLVLTSVHSVEIVSTWKELSDTCILKLPSRGILNAGSKLEQVSFEQRFKTGMPVKVEIGYNDNLTTEFEGYVAEVRPGFPFELRCEDQMWTLKRSAPISKSYKSVKVSTLLKELVPEVKVDPNSPDVTIDNFLIERATKAKVLQELKEKYGMAIYFRGKQLYAGLPYFDRVNEVVVLGLQQNIPDGGDKNLVYKKADDVRLKARVVSLLPNNKRITIDDVGDADGDERTIHYYNVSDKALLRKRAEAELKKFKYEGYRGSIRTFGLPVVKHSQAVEIRDQKYTERNGRYLVDAVRTSFGVSGFSREIEMAIRV